ncbi:MAG: O-antigen ligase family protein [Phycisphaerales bacterium]
MNLDLDFLLSPVGIALSLGAVTLLVMLVVSLRNSLFILGAMLFVGALAVPAEASKDYASTVTWLMPLQVQRSLIYLGCGALLTLGLLVHIGRVRVASFTGTGILLLFVAGYAGLMTFYHSTMLDGAQTVISALLTIGSLSILLPSLLNTLDDFYRLLRVIVFVSVFYTGAVVVQLLLNRTPLIVPNAFRFQGISGNPQFVAVFLAVVVTTTVFLIMNDTQKRYKLLYVALTSLNVVLLIWTGSRTGALMSVIGLTAVLYTRLGRGVLVAPFVVVGVSVMMQVLTAAGVNIGLDRLTSTEDTRSHVWRVMIDLATQNPVFGVGVRGVAAAENSFLLATASYGFGSFFTLLLLAIGSAVQCVRLLGVRFRGDTTTNRFADLQIGFFLMYFAGSMFEGFIIARISVMLPIYLIFSAITSRLIEIDKQARMERSLVEDYADGGGLFTEPAEETA